MALLTAAAVALTLATPGLARAAEPGSITGRVTDLAGQPVGPADGVCVAVGNSSDGNFSNLGVDGTYRIDGVEPGSWAVRFVQCVRPSSGSYFAPQYYPDIHDPSAGRVGATPARLPNVVVRSGVVTPGIDARMRPGGTITVDVVDRTGVARGGICVDADPTQTSINDPAVGQIHTRASEVTNSSGRALLRGLAPGSYWVKVRACDNWVLSDPDLVRSQYSNGVFRQEQAAAIPVALSGAATVPVTMGPGASMTGIVTADGAPVADRCVQWRVDNEIGGGYSNITTSTDSDGRYRFEGLNPIVGRLGACGGPGWPDLAGGTAPLWYPAGASARTASLIQLQAGTALTMDFALQRERTVSAVVSQVPPGRSCQVVMSSGGVQRRMDLRPGNRSREWFGDLFDHTFSPSWNERDFHLECDGRRSGSAQSYEHPGTSGFPTSTEDLHWRVLYFLFDETGPVITPSVNATTMPWTRSAITVSFNCVDAGIGLRTCPSPVRFTEGQVATVSATDQDGNVSNLRVGPLRIDGTPPRVTVANRQRTFRSSEVISLGCSVRDGRSGLRTQTNQCPPAGTKASSLGIGEHKFSIVGTDHAGNSVRETVTVTVVK